MLAYDSVTVELQPRIHLFFAHTLKLIFELAYEVWYVSH